MGKRKTSTELPDNRDGDWVPLASDMAPTQKDSVGSKESEGRVVSDRFDLEQEILECWRVTNDIKLFVEQGADLKVLSDYYDQKFEKLWATFESMCHNGKLG